MGHGFGVHEELVHVPLFMRVPGLDKPKQVETRVSTTRVFYSILDYLGYDSLAMPYAEEVDIASHSLLGMVDEDANGQAYAISEAYAPENAIEIIRKHHPELIDDYHPEHTQRAVYQGDEKMIAVEEISKVLFSLAGDPTEQQPYQDESKIKALSKVLDNYLELAMSRNASSSQRKISLKDELIQQRLRDLGYLE
jgi:arylsulfatase A-like enzyme